MTPSTDALPPARAPLERMERVIDIQPDDIYGGHVNNTRYFIYIGDTFRQWYHAMRMFPDVDPGPLMAHLSLDYLREMTYPGQVLCRLEVVRVGKSSLEHAIELRNAAQPDELFARGRGVNVWFDRARGGAAPWPADVLARCWTPDKIANDQFASYSARGNK